MLDKEGKIVEERSIIRRDPIIERMLIVDDEVGWVKNLKSLFRNTSRVIDSVEGGMDTFRKIIDTQYDCIIVDLKLSDGCGLNLIPRIKVHNPNAFIVVITGYESEYKGELRELAVKEEILLYFSKTDNYSLIRSLTNLKLLIRRWNNGSQRFGNIPNATRKSDTTLE